MILASLFNFRSLMKLSMTQRTSHFRRLGYSATALFLAFAFVLALTVACDYGLRIIWPMGATLGCTLAIVGCLVVRQKLLGQPSVPKQTTVKPAPDFAFVVGGSALREAPPTVGQPRILAVKKTSVGVRG